MTHCISSLFFRWETRREVDCVWRAGWHTVDREYELCYGWQQGAHTLQWRENLYAWTGENRTGDQTYGHFTTADILTFHSRKDRGLTNTHTQQWVCSIQISCDCDPTWTIAGLWTRAKSAIKATYVLITTVNLWSPCIQCKYFLSSCKLATSFQMKSSDVCTVL